MKISPLVYSAAVSSYAAALVIPDLDNEALQVKSNEVSLKYYIDEPKGSDIKEASKSSQEIKPKKSNGDDIVELIANVGLNAESISISELKPGTKIVPFSYIITFKPSSNKDHFYDHLRWVNSLNDRLVAQHYSADYERAATSADSINEQKKENESSFSLGGVKHSYQIGDFKGYSGYFLPETISYILRHPAISSVERDSYVHTNKKKEKKPTGDRPSIEEGAPWGLARISHRDALTFGTIDKYVYAEHGGEGVTSYVIDTGINVDHVEFEGRARWGATIPQYDYDFDGNGHGTHCAGTIASKTYGVAKNANVVAVKVLRSNGSGTMSDVVKGVEWAANAHIAETKKAAKGFKGSTANMSLGGGKSPSLDAIVNAAVKAGLHFAVAAGNEDDDACDVSPAGAEKAVTVGASTSSDERAYFSNWGKCVDIFAPGYNVLSTYIGSPYATARLSGTSMASPHVAGLLAYYLSLQPDFDSGFSSKKIITPEQLKKNLIAFGTKDVIANVPEDTPNILIYNGGGENLTEFWSNKNIKDNRVKIDDDKENDFEKAINAIGENNLFKPIINKINAIDEMIEAVKDEFHVL